MNTFFRSLFSLKPKENTNGLAVLINENPVTEIDSTNSTSFSMSGNLFGEAGLPILFWGNANTWLKALEDNDRRLYARKSMEKSWLQHLRLSLGEHYCLYEKGDSLVLSSLESNVADASLNFIAKSLERIEKVLDGIANTADLGRNILIVLDDEQTYYQYISQYYTDDGEFSFSGGMYINDGCGHFVTMKSDLSLIEPVIIHELTHSCLSHLPIPLWLNEGIAVNTEHRLSPASAASKISPDELNAKHKLYWGEAEIQEFWSGKSFERPDQGNMLSYDLARIMVALLSKNWGIFTSFVLNAKFYDAGASAANSHLQQDLGDIVAALLEQNSAENWSPAK